MAKIDRGQISRRARTGCLTCKVRKIKCDETMPSCQRCLSSGWRCDGYADQLRSVLLSQPGRSYACPNTRTEDRAVQFFHTKAARAISGPYDSSFWTTIVLQLSENEPAVRHALVATSVLYEDLIYNYGSKTSQARNNELLLIHYNAAIRGIQAIKDPALILVVCLLFICIETMQNNKEQAITHSRHGLQIYQNTQSTAHWVRNIMGPIFLRLRVMPFFWGRPHFAEIQWHGQNIPTTRMISVDEATNLLDEMFIEAVRLVSYGKVYRDGRLSCKHDLNDLLAYQTRVRQFIQQLRLASARVTWNDLQPEERDVRCSSHHLRIEVCWIWASLALDSKEQRFDSFNSTFEAINRLARRLGRAMSLNNKMSEAQFWLEPAYVPFIVFVVLKCRDFDLRLDALRMLRQFGPAREGLCEMNKVYLRGRRVIEVEHNVQLNQWDQPVGPFVWDETVPEERRVRDVFVDNFGLVRAKVRGKDLTGVPEGFIMQDAKGNSYVRIEFITVKLDDEGGRLEYAKLDTNIRRPYLSSFQALDTVYVDPKYADGAPQ